MDVLRNRFIFAEIKEAAIDWSCGYEGGSYGWCI